MKILVFKIDDRPSETKGAHQKPSSVVEIMGWCLIKKGWGSSVRELLRVRIERRLVW